jgi:hypothetical protein
MVDEAVERARWHTGTTRQLARRPPGWRGPHHPVARALIDRGQRPRHRGLARPRQRLDHIDGISARRDRPHHCCLFVAQRCGQRREGIVDELCGHGSRTGALPAHNVDHEPSLARQQTRLV